MIETAMRHRLGTTDLLDRLHKAAKQLGRSDHIPYVRLCRFLLKDAKKREGVPEPIRELFEIALGYPSCTFTLMPDCRPRPVRSQDLKTCLIDAGLKRRLRSLKTVPDLTSVVFASRMKYFDEPKEKTLPAYHYVQLSTVVTVRWPGADDHWLIAVREPREKDIQHRLTTGKSILFAASLELGGRDPRPMDSWLFLARTQPELAEQDLCHGESSRMVYVLSYKLHLAKYGPRFKRRGVVRTLKGAWYTQFVFECTLQFRRKPSPRMIAELSSDETKLDLEPKTSDPTEVCRNTKGEILAMDVAAWRGLIGSKPRVQYPPALFVRGFDIVPKGEDKSAAEKDPV